MPNVEGGGLGSKGGTFFCVLSLIQAIKFKTRASVCAKCLALISKKCAERLDIDPFRQEPSPITRLPGVV